MVGLEGRYLFLAQSGHFATEFQCLLLGVKRTWLNALPALGILQLAAGKISRGRAFEFPI
jgi:hypothetical protein